MRIKLTGAITVELLAEALKVAALAQSDDFSGFRDGNLYINTISKSGHQFPPKSAEQKLEIEVSGAANGSYPYVAIEVDRLRRAEIKKEAQASLDKQKAESQRLIVEHMAKLKEREIAWNIAKIEQQRRDALFADLIDKCGDELIDAINQVVSEVWAEARPVFPNNGRYTRKGDPRPVPHLERHGPVIHLHTDATGKQFKQIKSPLSVVVPLESAIIQLDANGNHFRPLLKYVEWTDLAVPRIAHVIETFAEKWK